MNAAREAFRAQARACEGLGSPFMARLMRMTAERLAPGSAVPDRVLGWTGEIGPSGASVPLRLAGALHALVRDGTDAGLTAVYPPAEASDDAIWTAIEGAFSRHEARLLTWLESPPQTNEVRRSSALIAAAAWIGGRFALPFSLSELGASAGLNLFFDRFTLEAAGARLGAADSAVRLTPDWRGVAPEPRPIRVVERAGVDLNPLDPRDPAARIRLLAYLWPDQPERLRLTEAAIALSEARPDRGDAADWLTRRLDRTRYGRVHLIYHTIAWQYFAPATQAACGAAIAAAGAVATEDAPLAHVALEADDGPESGAALTATLWPGGGTHTLGRVDFHGRWIEWHG